MKKIFLLLFILVFSSPCFGADYFSWSSRTDRNGNAAGIYATTPYPVIESTNSFEITHKDEGNVTYTISSRVFVDGTACANGCSNGDTDYTPGSQTCGAGSYTVYDTIAHALTGIGAGEHDGVAILIRDGTYTLSSNISLSGHYGKDNTNRLYIIGYNQERPILDGDSGTNYIFSRQDSTNANAYITLQRLKLYDTMATGLRLGNAAGMDNYFNLLDVWFYECAGRSNMVTGTHTGGISDTVLTDSSKSWLTNQYNGYYLRNTSADNAGTGTITSNTSNTATCSGGGLSFENGDSYVIYYSADSNCYYYNADNGYISHCTFERSSWHGLKVGDESDDCIIEWSVSKDNGYWSGIDPAINFNESVGIDLPSDANASGNTVRYSIVYNCNYHGIAFRKNTNFSCHHNEIYSWGHRNDLIGRQSSGTSSVGVSMSGDDTYGSLYSNIIRDIDSDETLGVALAINADNSESAVYTIYNNLIYGVYPGTSTIKISSYPDTGATVYYYNNSHYVSTGSGDEILIDENGSTSNIKNNIFYQYGVGNCVDYVAATVNDYNLYYYPSGAEGSDVDGTHDQDPASQNFWVSVPSGAYSGDEGALTRNGDATNNGTDLSGTFTDSFNGITRGASWDIGAYEYYPGACIIW